MDIQKNDDFKYVIQDTNCVYFGRELTYTEMMDREDVPFKFKAVISTYIAKDTDLDIKMPGHILKLSKDDFSYHILKRLKTTVRVCYKAPKKGLGGKVKEKWVHKACSIEEFLSEYREEAIAGRIDIEDISISKFALMTV